MCIHFFFLKPTQREGDLNCGICTPLQLAGVASTACDIHVCHCDGSANTYVNIKLLEMNRCITYHHTSAKEYFERALRPQRRKEPRE